MCNRDLDEVLKNVQDHRSEDEQNRLRFLLSEDDTARAVDPTKVSENDLTGLVKLFEEMDPNETVQNLKGKISFQFI